MFFRDAPSITPTSKVKAVPALGEDWMNQIALKEIKNENDFISYLHVLKNSSTSQMLVWQKNRAHLLDYDSFAEKETKMSSYNAVRNLFELSDGRILYFWSEYVVEVYDPQTDLEPQKVDANINCDPTQAAMLSEDIFVCINRNKDQEIRFYNISNLTSPIDTLKVDKRIHTLAVVGSDCLVTGGYNGEVYVYQKGIHKFVKISDITQQLAELATQHHVKTSNRKHVQTWGPKRDRVIILDDYIWQEPKNGLITSWQINEKGHLTLVTHTKHTMEIPWNIEALPCGERFLMNNNTEMIVWDSKLKPATLSFPQDTKVRNLQSLPDGRFAAIVDSSIQKIQFGPIVPDDERIKRIVENVLFPGDTKYVPQLASLITAYADTLEEKETKTEPQVVDHQRALRP